MLDVSIEYDQRRFAYNLVKNNNYGNRGRFDGNFERQYTGILGEIVMADGLGLERPMKAEFDDGIDFEILGLNVDLKTMGRTTPVRDYYVNNLLADQTKTKTDVYVFSSINKETRVMTFIGAIPKRNLYRFKSYKKGEERERSDGSKFKLQMDLYEIPNKDLIQVGETWSGLLQAIDKCRHE